MTWQPSGWLTEVIKNQTIIMNRHRHQCKVYWISKGNGNLTSPNWRIVVDRILYLKEKSFRVHSLHVTTNLAHFVISLLILTQTRITFKAQWVFFYGGFLLFRKEKEKPSIQIQLSDNAKRKKRYRDLCAIKNSSYR